VTLSCEVSRANADVTWLKDDAQLQIDNHLELVSVDRARRLTIHEATLEDEAEYTVALSDTVNTKATLWVEGTALIRASCQKRAVLRFILTPVC